MNETSRAASRAAETISTSTPGEHPALCVVGCSSVRLWSHNTADRLIIQFARAGIDHVLNEQQAVLGRSSVIMVRADAVLDQPLIRILIDCSN
ncbi:MAG: hypothetical protein ACREDW_00510, partial [Aestuariivirgaceae bacterium]